MGNNWINNDLKQNNFRPGQNLKCLPPSNDSQLSRTKTDDPFLQVVLSTKRQSLSFTVCTNGHNSQHRYSLSAARSIKQPSTL